MGGLVLFWGCGLKMCCVYGVVDDVDVCVIYMEMVDGKVWFFFGDCDGGGVVCCDLFYLIEEFDFEWWRFCYFVICVGGI